VIKIGSRPPPSFDEPLAALLHCHEKMRERLDTLERAAAALAADSDPTPAFTAIREVLEHFARAGTRHTEDEEGSVWPRVRSASLDPVLDELSTEHRAVEAIQLALRDTVSGAVRDEAAAHARAFAAAYREHMRREEEHVFPAIGTLDPAEVRAIGIEMRLRRG
jgi:hemerythrin-like domain-containing protein